VQLGSLYADAEEMCVTAAWSDISLSNEFLNGLLISASGMQKT
jgi:hypothetical protein